MSSSQSATTEELESVRFELFREAGYADNLDFNNPIFKKLSNELSVLEQLRFPEYFKKLASAERQLDLFELFPKLDVTVPDTCKSPGRWQKKNFQMKT